MDDLTYLEFFSVMHWKEPAKYPPLQMKRKCRGDLCTENLWSPSTHGKQQLSRPVLTTISGNCYDFLLVVLGVHLDLVIDQSLLEMKLGAEFFGKLQVCMHAELWIQIPGVTLE